MELLFIALNVFHTYLIVKRKSTLHGLDTILTDFCLALALQGTFPMNRETLRAVNAICGTNLSEELFVSSVSNNKNITLAQIRNFKSVKVVTALLQVLDNMLGSGKIDQFLTHLQTYLPTLLNYDDVLHKAMYSVSLCLPDAANTRIHFQLKNLAGDTSESKMTAVDLKQTISTNIFSMANSFFVHDRAMETINSCRKLLQINQLLVPLNNGSLPTSLQEYVGLCIGGYKENTNVIYESNILVVLLIVNVFGRYRSTTSIVLSDFARRIRIQKNQQLRKF